MNMAPELLATSRRRGRGCAAVPPIPPSGACPVRTKLAPPLRDEYATFADEPAPADPAQSSVTRRAPKAARLSAPNTPHGKGSRVQVAPVPVAYRRFPMKIQAALPCRVMVPGPGKPPLGSRGPAGSTATADHWSAPAGLRYIRSRAPEPRTAA